MDVPPVGLRTERAHPRGLVEVNLDERLRARAHVGPAPDVDAVVLATFRAVMEHAKTLVDLQDVDGSVERARATHPVVVRRALEVVELTDVLAIVRALLRERIPVPPMRMVLSTLAESRRFCDAAERPQWPEIARLRLAPYWMHEVLDALSRLGPPRWVRLDPEAEDELLDRVTVAEDGLMLSATSGERAQWHAQLLQVAEVAGDVADGNVPGIRRGPIVVLTTPKARRAAAELFSGMTPHVPVLSTAELQRAHAPAPQPVRWLAPP